MTFAELLESIRSYNCNLVGVTGGEPLVQPETIPFLKLLCDEGFEVLLETGGHMDISSVDRRVHRIMDIKCPSSAESEKNLWDNLSFLTSRDEIKFVIGNREDYDYAKDVLVKDNLSSICTVLMSPVFGSIDNTQLADWILEDNLPVRYQLQMHKYIWPPDTKGV